MGIVHQHITVDGNCENPTDDTEFLKNWLSELVNKVNMEIAIPPQAALIEDETNWGPTAIVGITTSHCSIHMWTRENPPYFCFDLYSCREYDEDVVIKHLNVFKPYNVNIQRLNRGITC